jgi:hypothetical protein
MYTSMLGVTSFGLVGHRRLPTISFYTNMFRLLSIDDLVSTFHLKIPVLNPKKKKKKKKKKQERCKGAALQSAGRC